MDFEAFIEALREQRKTARERELEKQIAEIGMKHRRALDLELAPLLDELTEINKAKGPLPVIVDGKVYEYI